MAEKKSHSTLLVQTTSLCLFVVVVVVVVVGRGRGCGLGWALIQGWALIYQTKTVHTVQRRGTQRGYSSKPLNIAFLNVF